MGLPLMWSFSSIGLDVDAPADGAVLDAAEAAGRARGAGQRGIILENGEGMLPRHENAPVGPDAGLVGVVSAAERLAVQDDAAELALGREAAHPRQALLGGDELPGGGDGQMDRIAAAAEGAGIGPRLSEGAEELAVLVVFLHTVASRIGDIDDAVAVGDSEGIARDDEAGGTVDETDERALRVVLADVLRRRVGDEDALRGDRHRAVVGLVRAGFPAAEVLALGAVDVDMGREEEVDFIAGDDEVADVGAGAEAAFHFALGGVERDEVPACDDHPVAEQVESLDFRLDLGGGEFPIWGRGVIRTGNRLVAIDEEYALRPPEHVPEKFAGDACYRASSHDASTDAEEFLAVYLAHIQFIFKQTR